MKSFTGVVLFGLAAATAFGADPHMTQAERAKVLGYLRDSEKEFLAMVADVSDAGWTFKPGPNRWSVGETAEHIMLSEGALFSMAQKALASPENPDWEAKTKGKTEFIERVMVDRSHKATAPEAIRPQGLSREDVMRRYREARVRTMKFVEETGLPLKAHTSEHPFPVFNTLNAYQWLLYIPLHNMRHDQQIAEVKASGGFPK